MRSRRLAAALVPLAVLALFALPVAAEEDADPCRGLTEDEGAAEVCEVRYYLQCAGTTAGKLNVAPDIVNGFATFTDAPPAGSFTAGEGCGEVDQSVFRGTRQDTAFSFDFGGIADGNIDAITVELHDFAFTPARFDEELVLDVRMTVEGASPFGMDSNTSATGVVVESPKVQKVTVQPELSETMLTTVYRFTVTDLDAVIGTARDALPDHEVKVTIDVPGRQGATGWVWGAEEVPSGVTINPLEPAGTIVPATG